MNTNIKLEIKGISYHLIWIMILLESITVSILATFSHHLNTNQQLKSIWNGFFIAFIGTYITIFTLNYCMKKLNIKLNDEVILAIVPIILVSFWSGLLLGILFYIQELVIHLHLTPLPAINLMLAGFISTAISSFVVYWIYYLVTKRFNHLRIMVITVDARYSLISLSIYLIALLVGIYELIALPIINTWKLFPYYLQIPAGAITGVIGGGIGTVVVILLYQLIRKKYSIFFLFSKDI